ncbi:MAG: hypothetical protein ACI4EX_00785 [Lachnospiraceae bacterium]
MEINKMRRRGIVTARRIQRVAGRCEAIEADSELALEQPPEDSLLGA